MLLLGQGSALTRGCAVCAFDQNLPCSSAILSHQNPKWLLLRRFQPYRIHAARIHKHSPRKIPIISVPVPNSVGVSWSLLLLELAQGCREGIFPLLPFHNPFPMIPWLLAAEPPISQNHFIASVPLINYLSPGLLKIC